MTIKPVPTELEDKIGHQFTAPVLFWQALSHASVDANSGADNERLEFLGDRVLGLVVAEALLEKHPKAKEGDLALRLNAAVRRETCAAVARDLGLGEHLRMARSEELTGGRNKPAILADACEALIAAVFLDGGFDAAKRFVRRSFAEHLNNAAAMPVRDAKTALQEWAQSKGRGLPRYDLVSRDGPDHAPNFVIRVSVTKAGDATGSGASRRAAEQAAAAGLLTQQGVAFGVGE
jgi:ribonuclease-3